MGVNLEEKLMNVWCECDSFLCDLILFLVPCYISLFICHVTGARFYKNLRDMYGTQVILSSIRRRLDDQIS